MESSHRRNYTLRPVMKVALRWTEEGLSSRDSWRKLPTTSPTENRRLRHTKLHVGGLAVTSQVFPESLYICTWRLTNRKQRAAPRTPDTRALSSVAQEFDRRSILESTQSDPRDTTTALLTCVPASTNAVAPVGSRNLLNGFHCFQCVGVVMQEAASSSLFSVPVSAEIEGVIDG